MKAGPIAMPGEIDRPVRVRSPRSVFIEAAVDQCGERIEGGRRLRPDGAHLDHGARSGRQHHQPHNRASRHFGSILCDRDVGVVFPGELDEARGGARMKAALVADGGGAPQRRGAVHIGHFTSARSCEATLMYLRPASCAPRTALASVSVWRSPASLISIGRLIPAITSILLLSMTEMARFDGVPPNISVSNTTPEPSSTSDTAVRMSCRRFSMSSSGPIHTAAMAFCPPTTC